MYGDVDGVQALVPGVGMIDDSSVPTGYQVESWLTEASAIVDGALASAGYASPVSPSATLYASLAGMSQLYAAANVLQARGLDTASGGEENRSEQMFKRFYAQLKATIGGNLENLGVSLLTTTPRRRRLRSTQTRRVDGYSGAYEGSATEYSYPSE